MCCVSLSSPPTSPKAPCPMAHVCGCHPAHPHLCTSRPCLILICNYTAGTPSQVLGQLATKGQETTCLIVPGHHLPSLKSNSFLLSLLAFESSSFQSRNGPAAHGTNQPTGGESASADECLVFVLPSSGQRCPPLGATESKQGTE